MKNLSQLANFKTMSDFPVYLSDLKEKISNHSALVGVVGLGYVGLPFAIEKVKVGFSVMMVKSTIAFLR
jgi:heterodisulfide reductase subunit A-like polyferredoxin